GNGPFTLFAPTNQAFREAGFPSIASIQAADPNTLAGILTVHAISGRAFSCDLSNGQTVNTLSAGKTIKVNITGSGVFVKVNPTSTEAQVIGTDVMARNGVVHVINKVLLP
ncbi:MAG: fasciclin domain-containing protein, partial [Dinghuibacter sp.]|nr:fasciclin domain-containing protein [Dinghuibacter sp.]